MLRASMNHHNNVSINEIIILQINIAYCDDCVAALTSSMIEPSGILSLYYCFAN